MPAPRRFVTDAPTTAVDFARDVLVESWRSLLPQDSLVVRRRGLRGRLTLLGADTVRLDTATAGPLGADGRRIPGTIAAGSLARLWHRSHGFPLRAHADAIAVTAGDGQDARPDDLAAATVAVAGELGLRTVTVVRLHDRDAAATNELVRAVRRVSDLPVSSVVHARSTETTVAALASCALVVTHDDTAAAVTESLGTPTCRCAGDEDLTTRFLAIRAAATTVPADSDASRDARSLAFSLDAWARGRVSTRSLFEAVAHPASVDDLVGA